MTTRDLGMFRAHSLLKLAAGLEVATALTLIVAPGLFAALLVGGELTPAGTALARLGGFSLLSLVVAVWPRGRAAPGSALRAMLVFSATCALYLIACGVQGTGAGVLLWPAAATHTALGLLLARARGDEEGSSR